MMMRKKKFCTCSVQTQPEDIFRLCLVDSLHTEPTDMVGNYIYTKKLWIVHTVYVRFRLKQMSRGFTG